MKPKILSWFFGPRKKEKTLTEKLEEAMPLIVKMIPEIKKLYRGNVDPSVESDGRIIGQMYDFFSDADGVVTINHRPRNWDDEGNPLYIEDKRIQILPIKVRDELELPPTQPSVENIDEKIALLKDKALLTNQRFVGAQIDGMIKRLENRRKYKEHREFFQSFPVTTDEKIDLLLKKYKLEIHNSDLFVPNFPAEAVAIMKKYSEVTQKVSGEKPVFYVIAEEKDFQEKRKKLDPILLAQSPFSFNWDVLGAWDKEMLLLSEL